MTAQFQREDRYIVVKLKHLRAAQAGAFPDNKIHGLLNYLSATGVEPVKDALVIEADWPEYEPAWRMIERRVTGHQPPALGGEVIQRWHPQKTPIGTIIKPHSEGDFVQLSDHSAHVARLQAIAVQAEQDFKDVVGAIELRDIEIARLQAEVERLGVLRAIDKKDSNEIGKRFDRLVHLLRCCQSIVQEVCEKTDYGHASARTTLELTIRELRDIPAPAEGKEHE